MTNEGRSVKEGYDVRYRKSSHAYPNDRKLLRTQYHAEGKGLHQLISSCEERLPHDVIAKLRFIATVRNKVVHEDNYKLDDRKGFMAACDDCEKS